MILGLELAGAFLAGFLVCSLVIYFGARRIARRKLNPLIEAMAAYDASKPLGNVDVVPKEWADQ